MASQMFEKIKVFARVRPSKEEHFHRVVEIEDRKVLVNLNNDPKPFQFDGVYGENSKQDEVFDGAASRIVHGTLQGYNGTIFAYGQTGSGKTHTMIGPSSSFDDNSGIIPRSLQLLFEQLDKKANEMPGNFKSNVTISFVEIYNEIFYDLFVMNNEKLKIGQDHEGNAIVKGATEVFVKDLNDAMQEVMNGWKGRKVAETAMNRASSRSHALLMIKVHTEEAHGTVSTSRSAFLNLVDLAGSERVSQSKVEGERFRETAQINKSLHNLTLVIRELSEKKNHGFIPFRNSVLTHILQGSLGGNARTAVMINLHPDKMYYSETLSTLNFSTEVRRIENKVIVNEDLKGDSVMAFQVEIKRLKEEMLNISNKNDEEMSEMNRQLNAWREAANKYERQLAVARRNAVNAAIVARKDGLAASQAESIWEKSMAEVAESVRDVPSSNIRSIQLKELTEQFNLVVFEKDELQSQLDDERRAKGELQERVNRLLEGTMSPRRRHLNSSSSQESGPLEATFALPSDAKKERRRTRYTPAKERQSNFFRPVLDVEGEGEGQPSMVHSEPDNVEERREMEMEMQLNTQKQIIDDKIQESESLSRLLKDAESRIAEFEEKLAEAGKSVEDEKQKTSQLTEKIEKVERAIVEEKEKVIELEKRELDMKEQLDEAKAQVDRLQSDSELLKSIHEDELKELESRLIGNLSDKEKKEVDLKNEIDCLKGEVQNIALQLHNKEAEKEAQDEVLKLIRDKFVEVEEEMNIKNGEVEALTSQLEDLRGEMEASKKKMEEERRKSEEEEWKKQGLLKELEEGRKKMGEMEARSTAKEEQLQIKMGNLRIQHEADTRKKVAEVEKEVEHWKTVSLQFSEKMDEFRAELNTEKEKRSEADAREKRTNERLAMYMAESEELKENLSALGTHGNTKQKLHTFNRYVENNRVLTLRVSQLEGALQRHGIAVPQPEKEEEREGDASTSEGQRETLVPTENGNPPRRTTRAASSSSTVASAPNSKASKSTRTSTRK